MTPREIFQSMPGYVRFVFAVMLVAIPICIYGAYTALIPQIEPQTTPVVSLSEDRITWHMDPYVSMRVNTETWEYHIGKAPAYPQTDQFAPSDDDKSSFLMSLPSICLTGDDVADADYIVIFGNDSGYAVVAKSFEGSRGKADPDIQFCYVRGQESALKALHLIADQFTSLAAGNWVVWHEGTKAYAAMVEFRSPAPASNRNN